MSILALSTRGRHVRRRKPMSRTRRLSAGSLAALGFAMMFWAGLGGVTVQQSANAAPSAAEQCNGIATTPGLEITCDVSVVNNLDVATGTSSSTVTQTVCQGAANATPTCAPPTTTSFTGLTTSVTQCNGSVLGGGGVIICDVNIMNNITGDATATTATVNQCNGSGQGGGVELTCNPTASTTGATITQCNGSGNGGAGVSVTCTVAPSTQSTALPVTVNQCVGSGNGGGSVVTCTVSVTNQIIPATVPTAPVTTAPVTTAPVTTAPVTTAPVTTAPVTTAPVTTAPATNGAGANGAGTNGSVTNGSGINGSGKPGAGVNGSGTSRSSDSRIAATVLSAPVLAPSLNNSTFTAPAGLTGDSAPHAAHGDPLLWGLALGCLAAGLLLIVVRSPR